MRWSCDSQKSVTFVLPLLCGVLWLATPMPHPSMGLWSWLQLLHWLPTVQKCGQESQAIFGQSQIMAPVTTLSASPLFDDASAATLNLCSSLCVSDDIWCQLLTDCCLLLSSNTTRSDFIFYSDRLVSCQPCFQTYPPTGLERWLRYLFLFLLSLTDPPGGGGRTELSTVLQTHRHHSNW